MWLLPGDPLVSPLPEFSIGLFKDAGQITSGSAGQLMAFNGGKYWVNFQQVGYTPLLDDVVLGVIKGKGKDYYRVDIGSSSLAIVDFMDFPNATKRNRPTLSLGDIILGQIVLDSKTGDIRISCRTEVVTEMGQLKDGILIKCGILRSRAAFLSPPEVLNGLVSRALWSMNGYAWITPPSPEAVQAVLTAHLPTTTTTANSTTSTTKH
ncbi:exosome complex component RRP40 [Nematocida homosporus]|uniref:exosome complex component RRP40 n=1 Tax=Nematocida homosporus TaxID=1912981 RepID=UPI0022210D23|nr:exosome complex component RRP40 [Nematocida homosporus]KAI5187356.1 exosome complex component RRP40 [Nematocida homosporus]